MTDAGTTPVPEHQLCEMQVDSVAVVTVDDDGEENIEVAESGHGCPNDAVALAKSKTHAGGPMEFYYCEEHLEEEREKGHIIELVDPADSYRIEEDDDE